MDPVIGFVVSVVLQLWQLYVPVGITTVLSLTLLRVVLPLVLTAAIVFWLHRMDARWHAVPIAHA